MRQITRKTLVLMAAAFFLGPVDFASGEGVTITVETPMPPPGWALMERELLRAQEDACKEFFARYFDSRGWLECVERWGGDDGPDDAIENVNDWPILHALGGSDEILTMYKQAWEGHLRQFTLAKTTQVPFARDGMYYKEFPVMFDWVHNGEGLTVFNLQGLGDPSDPKLRQRIRRFAGFYMNEDPGAPNYDPEHKIIKSLFNGSRGPLLRKATAVDWAGDPVEVKNRFLPRHGEDSYEQMLAHFEEYNDIVGDHPQNLAATSLAFNAFALTGDRKYRDWLLGYVDAWSERTHENGGIIPTNIGLDGKIGSAAGGKWYGGVYGWGFTITVPQTGEKASRNTHALGLTGFGNALLLTGDQHYVDVWRNMTDVINAQGKVVDGTMMYPRMYGDHGWYDFTPAKYSSGAQELWYWSMRRDDFERLPQDGWLAYLEGKSPAYPEQALQAEFAALREKVEAMRKDPTTPDTRLSDDPMPYNPATLQTLINVMLGGIHPGQRGAPLHCRVRYFDPERRRAGVPEDVAALVDRLSDGETSMTLVNVSQTEPRTVIVQTGGYAEHQCESVTDGSKRFSVDSSTFTVKLAPGCGTRLTLTHRRYANPPTMRFPWERG
ncbi:MAG: hypothetical protein WD648_01510 [Planctomycetaceae bacterium]